MYISIYHTDMQIVRKNEREKKGERDEKASWITL